LVHFHWDVLSFSGLHLGLFVSFNQLIEKLIALLPNIFMFQRVRYAQCKELGEDCVLAFVSIDFTICLGCDLHVFEGIIEFALLLLKDRRYLHRGIGSR
jgi:hypothetical protein